VAAGTKSKDLIQQITLTTVTSSDEYRDQVRSFADRAATFQCGMNILFLDPDCSLQDPKLPPPAGVNHPGRHCKFQWDEEDVGSLLKIVAHTNCKIVLTSKWRNRATMRTNVNREFAALGLAPIIGRTEVLDGGVETGGGRPGEVLDFLDEYGKAPGGATIHGWVVVDETDFTKSPDYAKRFAGHFVRTDRLNGFTPQIADSVIELLRGRKLDAPKRQFVPTRFAGAPGLVYAAPSDIRATKNSAYDAQSSESESDDDSDSSESGSKSDGE